MKKIVLFAITFVFAAAFGVAYASEIGNGITDFSGRSYDSVSSFNSAESDPMPSVVEGSSAGGQRSADFGIEEMNNGITDFTDRTYDTSPNFGPAASVVKFHTLVKSAPVRAEVRDFGKPLTN